MYYNCQLNKTEKYCVSHLLEVTCFHSLLADGYCDDIVNFEDCDFDGGDCCLENLISLEFCEECQCKDPNGK